MKDEVIVNCPRQPCFCRCFLSTLPAALMANRKNPLFPSQLCDSKCHTEASKVAQKRIWNIYFLTREASISEIYLREEFIENEGRQCQTSLPPLTHWWWTVCFAVKCDMQCADQCQSGRPVVLLCSRCTATGRTLCAAATQRRC